MKKIKLLKTTTLILSLTLISTLGIQKTTYANNPFNNQIDRDYEIISVNLDLL